MKLLSLGFIQRANNPKQLITDGYALKWVHRTNICSELGTLLGCGDSTLSSLIDTYLFIETGIAVNVKWAKDVCFQFMCQHLREEVRGKKGTLQVIKSKSSHNQPVLFSDSQSTSV